jgi:hypothetical protein
VAIRSLEESSFANKMCKGDGFETDKFFGTVFKQTQKLLLRYFSVDITLQNIR